MEQEKNQVSNCYCCKAKKEVSWVRVTEAGEQLYRTTDKDMDIKQRFVCNSCNHLEK